MAITVLEAHQSRKIGPDYREYVYVVTGTDNEEEVQNAVAAQREQYLTIPNPYKKNDSDPDTIKLRQQVTVEQIIDDSNTAHHTWEATMRYEVEDTVDENEILNYSISITTNTSNIKVAYDQTHWVAKGEVDPGDFGNRIGVVRNGAGFDVQGVDCITPQATLEIERRYPLAQWNAKVGQVITRVGMVNSFSFEGFGPEEVLFSGARVTKGKDSVTASYQFLISLTELLTFPQIGTFTKRGWRYAWIYSRPDESRGIGVKTVALYMARVYRSASFFGIL